MSASKLFVLSIFGLAAGLMWWSGALPPIYDGLFNGVTVLRTHTVYIDGVPESQRKVSIWRIKFPEGITQGGDGDIISDDFDKDGRGRAGGQVRGIVSWLKDGRIIDNPRDNRNHDFSAESFGISIDNLLLEYKYEPELIKQDYCLPRDGVRGRGPCLAAFSSCDVSINFHGWNAYAVVPRNTLYKMPELVCSILRKNLDAWTIYIDDLRKPQRAESR